MDRTFPWWIAVALFFAPSAHATPLSDAISSICTEEIALAPVAAAALESGESLDGEELRMLAESLGIPAPSVRAWVGRGSADAVADFVRNWLREQNPVRAWARCGLAGNERDGWALVYVPRFVAVSPWSPHANAGDTVRIRVGSPAGTSESYLLVLEPSGRAHRADASTALDVHLFEPGRWEFQVVGLTALGPLPFATWHIDAGTVDAREPNESQEISSSYAVLASINETRSAARAAPVRTDPLLTSVAQQRAAELAGLGVVAHRVRAGDSPVARLRSAAIHVDRVAENVARARTLAEASARLDRSPSHRANRLDRSIDSVGIGVAHAGELVYLVELFASHPRLQGSN